MDLKNIKYIKVLEIKNTPMVEILDINEFVELIKEFNISFVFVKTDKEKRGYYEGREQGYFLIYKDGIAFKIKNNNYKTISDMIKGTSKGFSKGEEYYDAMKRGFINYDEYKDAMDLGYTNRDEYIESEKLGFRGALKKLKNISFDDYDYDDYYPIRNNIYYNFKSEGDVYHYAKKNGFKDFDELKKAFSMLFTNANEYRDAIEKGFSNGVDYKRAKDMGFDNPDEFKKALELKIKSKKEYDIYLQLENIKKNYKLGSIEEALLFKILLDLKPKKKLSAEKIWKKLQSMEENYKIDDGWYRKKLPDWFTTKFKNKEDLKSYLSKSEKIELMGYYDTDGEVFERKNLPQIRKIIVDGSNVAWAGGSKEKGDKPHAKNIKIVVDTLREKGYTDITVIIDASLNHIVDDQDILLELAKEKVLEEAPARTDADEYIIKYAKEYNAYIVTNDTFKDWKEKDKWVKENIDKYRVPFMILEGVVKFDEKIEKIGE